MRKRIVRVLFVFTMIIAVLGGSVSDIQAVEKIPVRKRVSLTEKLECTRSSSISDYESEPVNVKAVLASDMNKPSKTNYKMNSKQFILAPIKLEHTGILWLDYNMTGKGYADIWVLESCEIIDGQVHGMGYSFGKCYGGDVVEADGGVPITAGKTYWLYVQNKSRNPISINVRGELYLTSTTRSLSEGTSKWTIASGMTRSATPSDIYYKIKPSKTGYVSVELKAYGDGKSRGEVTLYNKNKKKISNAVNFESGLNGTEGKVYFGVSKGNTYYLRVNNVKDSAYWAYKYGVRYTTYSGTDRIIGTKLTAKMLTRKADATKTLFKANGKTSTDWYKFKVTSKRKTQLKFDTSRIKSGNVTVTFYKGSKKIGSSNTISAKTDNKIYNITHGTTAGKADQGTYYVKVVKSENASGLYSVRYIQ